MVSATTWCNNNILACKIEPTNYIICDNHQLSISYIRSRRIFNGKGSGNHSISIGHELDLMDQSINPYIATVQSMIQSLKLQFWSWNLLEISKSFFFPSSIILTSKSTTYYILLAFISTPCGSSIEIEREWFASSIMFWHKPKFDANNASFSLTWTTCF